MKKILLGTFLILGIYACQNKSKQKTNNEGDVKNIIEVGVFDKNGDSPYCITDAMEALKIDSAIHTQIVSASDIVSGKANDIDVFLFPGGGGRSETGSLGEIGQKRIVEMVKEQGKGVVGICAGAYILSITPGYPSLNISGGEAIDIEHDHRGHGLVKFSITPKGAEVFPELKDREICYSQYYEGPVLIPFTDSKYKYDELATMLSDVHLVEGTPAKMTSNRPFIIVTDVEKGKTASVVGHPESTQGMRWIIPRLVRLVANRELISYKSNVVRPDIHTKEILFDKEQSEAQHKAYYNLVGSKEEKLQAMHNIMNMRAWSAKKWIPPMVRDFDPEIRLLAAKMIVELERTDAIKDLEAAVSNEEDLEVKVKLQEQLELLKSIYGKVTNKD